MRVGVVCEGSTDYPVLETVIRASIPRLKPTCRLIQPDFDALRDRRPGIPGSGWQGVRALLKSPAVAVALDSYDLLVVQIDASVRKLREVATELRKTRDGEEDSVLEPLREHVAGWFETTQTDKEVIVLPKEGTEAWLVAVHTRRHHVEDIDDPAGELAARGLIPTDDGVPWKAQARFADLASPLASLVKERRKLAAVPELQRFVGELRRFERRRTAPTPPR